MKKQSKKIVQVSLDMVKESDARMNKCSKDERKSLEQYARKLATKQPEQDYDLRHEQVQAFQKEFKALVRKYMKKYPSNDFDADTLAMMQDKTSCYNPYIWS